MTICPICERDYPDSFNGYKLGLTTHLAAEHTWDEVIHGLLLYYNMCLDGLEDG